MPGHHSPEAMRALAITRLQHAYGLEYARHGVKLRAASDSSSERMAIYLLAERMLEADFETQMDQLVGCWLEYQKVREG